MPSSLGCASDSGSQSPKAPTSTSSPNRQPVKVALGEVEHGGDVDVTIWEGASSGSLDQSDVDEVAAAIEPDSLAGIVVYENVWAVPMWTALDRSSSRLVGAGRIVVDDLFTALDATEPS